MNTGMVYWITGLSGAGKTTIGTLFSKYLREKQKNVLFLDGDTLREVFGNDLGYSREDRFRCSMRYSRLCRLLSEQGQDVEGTTQTRTLQDLSVRVGISLCLPQ